MFVFSPTVNMYYREIGGGKFFIKLTRPFRSLDLWSYETIDKTEKPLSLESLLFTKEMWRTNDKRYGVTDSLVITGPEFSYPELGSDGPKFKVTSVSLVPRWIKWKTRSQRVGIFVVFVVVNYLTIVTGNSLDHIYFTNVVTDRILYI